MKKINLTQGEYALVDDEDYEFLSQWKWCTFKREGYTSYAIHSQNKKTTYMHRLLMKAKKGEHVDHINHDGLNNQRSNLRLCTRAQNQWNARKSKKNTSGYKGVMWHKSNKQWEAKIMANRKYMYLGSFQKKSDAVKVYREAAKEYHGEFANTNL